MIDLHCHIIPGIDDGAGTIEDSLEMARIAVENGTRIVAATSHGDFARVEPGEYVRYYVKKLVSLRKVLKKEGIPLKVAGGMELLVNEELLRYAQEHPLPAINGGRYILVEFRFDVSADLAEKSLDRLRGLGWKLVLAHPERYDFIRRDPSRVRALYRAGTVLQINKGSLSGAFGRLASRAADQMLREGIAGVVASDAHDPVLRTIDLEDTAAILDLYYGSDASRILLKRNPYRILSSEPFRRDASWGA